MREKPEESEKPEMSPKVPASRPWQPQCELFRKQRLVSDSWFGPTKEFLFNLSLETVLLCEFVFDLAQVGTQEHQS